MLGFGDIKYIGNISKLMIANRETGMVLKPALNIKYLLLEDVRERVKEIVFETDEEREKYLNKLEAFRLKTNKVYYYGKYGKES